MTFVHGLDLLEAGCSERQGPVIRDQLRMEDERGSRRD